MRFRLVLVRFCLICSSVRAVLIFFSSSRHHAARLGVLFRQGRRGVASRAEAVVFFFLSRSLIQNLAAQTRYFNAE